MNEVRAAGRLAGTSLPARGEAERDAAIAAAVAYRGDVTVELLDGERVEGYVFAAAGAGEEARLRLLTSDGGRRDVEAGRVVAIHVTGADKAEGRSWQAWVQRHAEKRRLEALGLPSPSVEPQPEEL